MSNVTFSDIEKDRFLELMSMTGADIKHMNSYEKEELAKELSVYIAYFNKRGRHNFTKLFFSSAIGKLAALNGILTNFRTY
ncbi:hypothetical protein H6G33_10390 [Calothrix sp. FACHB-1219]|uniref:hypothetical protein n=1 Tax=unclassified Calothrix TaxID=2619626 RepID=UPI001689F484|nr:MULTISPECIES: hypothetical protein [unclassified Calothrix]MBD2201755.1 hypothetical protein [Calothrix sp. FACHB-168]MBD2217441.1 hypothetical protein [Calothrix sp. FACHB-1219]